jgi:hypothetical protein
MLIKLGIVGFSEGNGHPYSWSAIFNGYNVNSMENCGFPVIPRYLEKQAWPISQNKEAKVVSVLGNNLMKSNHLSKTTFIPEVCISEDQFIESCDAILFARDDVSKRHALLMRMLETKKYIFIDKPLATDLVHLNQLYSTASFEDQIFSATCLRYSPEINLPEPSEIENSNNLFMECNFSGKWLTYAVHVIEPVAKYFIGLKVDKYIKKATNWGYIHSYKFSNGYFLKINQFTNTNVKISFLLKTEGRNIFCEMQDSFLAFDSGLKAFLKHITGIKIIKEFDLHLTSTSLIELGAK